MQAHCEVCDEQEDHRDNQRNRYFGDQLRRRVDPDVVHPSVTLTGINRLLTLKNDNSGLEIQKHLHNSHKIDGACAVLNTLTRAKIVHLPETAHHQDTDDSCLHDLCPRQSRFALCKRPAPVHQLLQLDFGRSSASFLVASLFGRIEADYIVFCDDLLLEQGTVPLV